MESTDKEMSKIKSRFCKNVKIIKDAQGLERETGEVNLLTIPKKDLLYILSYSHREDGSTFFTTDENAEMRKWLDNLNGVNRTPEIVTLYFVEEIFVEKNIFNVLEVRKILNDTCTLSYMDCNKNDISSANQFNVDHNAVGKYKFNFKKPIPLEVIDTIERRLKKNYLKILRKDEKIKQNIKENIKELS